MTSGEIAIIISLLIITGAGVWCLRCARKMDNYIRKK